jgi:hypothetical protein
MILEDGVFKYIPDAASSVEIKDYSAYITFDNLAEIDEWVEMMLPTSGLVPEGLIGDVNGDGVVNGTDIQTVINFIIADVFDEKADVNKDGLVNGTDIQEIINIIVNTD